MGFNICCFTRITFAHAVKGGMEIQIRVLSEGLVKRGHRVTLLTTSLEPNLELSREENGVEIYYLPVASPGVENSEFWNKSVNRFKALHAKSPFDIAWGQQIGALGFVRDLQKETGIPLFSFFQSTLLSAAGALWNSRQFIFSQAAFPRASWRFSRNWYHLFRTYFNGWIQVYRNSDAIVCPSTHTAREVQLESWVSKSRITATVNGIDVSHFRPGPLLRDKGRDLLDLDPADFFILNVGRLTFDKGIHILLQAFAECASRLEGLKLGIAGVGPHLEALKLLVNDLGLQERVQFLGVIENRDLPAYYNACDIAVCPTMAIESYGISNAEAMACQKPVISSASGGTKYVVENEKSGLLVAPGNIFELSEAITRIYRNKDLAKKLSKNARERAIKFLSADRMIDDVETLIEKMAKRNL